MERLFCKGYTWGFLARKGDYVSKEAEYSMKRLKDDGCEWICLAVVAYQDTFASTEIKYIFGQTPSDMEIMYAIRLAKSMGLKVCLKPMVNCRDNVWRAKINFPQEQGYWDRWFKSYFGYMLHYAELAEAEKCEMLCTGCEMTGMDMQEKFCRELIKQVRNKYNGIIMHNVNHEQEYTAKWLDCVDVVGISGYYPLTTDDDLSKEKMISSWQRVKKLLSEVSLHYSKPVMFAEIGMRNEQGCSKYPWDFKMPRVEDAQGEQADFYESVMEVFWDEPWFAGFFWWDWRAKLPSGERLAQDRDFGIYGKQAENVLRDWYLNK